MTTRDIVAADRRVQYSGSSGLGPYSFAFQLNATSEIAVYIDSTLKTETTHYTVTLAAAGSGSITFASGQGPTALQTVTLVSNVPITRTSVYSVAGSLTAASLENDFDTNRIIAQQINEKAERSLHAPEHDPDDINMELPAKADRLSKVLQFDSSGEPIAVASLTDSATTTTPGLMSTADKTKLDGIEANATADQTASEILTAIKTVDGSASGLDADLLDGQHGSHYLDYNNFTNVPTLTTTLSALTDTTITSVGDNDLIAYDSSSSKFINQTPTEAGFATVATSGSYNDLSNTPTIPTNNNQLSNGAGYITSTLSGSLDANGNEIILDQDGDTSIHADTDDQIDIKVAGSDVVRFVDGRVDPASNNNIQLGTANARYSYVFGGTLNASFLTSSPYYISTVSTGTAPFTVSSTTKVTNLNADLLDGQEGSYYAPTASPALTGTPTAPTAAADTSTTQIATTAFVQQELAELIDSAPSTLDTLNEIAAAINDDPNFNTTVTTSLSNRLRIDTNSQNLTTTQKNNAISNLGIINATTILNGFMSAVDKTKLDGIETGATADQSDAEIKTAYENNSDTNALTDALLSKLNAIEASATADQTASEIRTLVESATDSNVFTDADHTKLNGIEANATADQTASELLTAIKTVDGPFSGLNADLLRGRTDSYLLDYTNFTNTPTIPTNNNQLTNGAGYITSSGNAATATTATNANKIKTTAASTLANTYLTFVDSNNGTASFEDLHTMSAFTVNSSSGRLNATSFGGDGSALTNVDADTLNSQAASYYLNYNNLTNTPTIPTATSDLTNDSGFLTSVPAQSFASLTGKPTTISGYGITDAFDGAYGSLTGTPTIPTNNNQLTNGAGYITSADGGNAQTLDSLDSTQFLRSDAADTKTSGNLTFSDNIELGFGTGDDLRLRHDGTDSYISNKTGNLYIGANDPSDVGGNVYLRAKIGENDTSIVLNDDSNINFFSDGAEKLAITPTNLISYVNIIIRSNQDIKFQPSALSSNSTTLDFATVSQAATITVPNTNGTVVLNESGILNLTNSGSQSELRLYCESNNAHYAALKAPAHSAFSGNVDITLPATAGTLALTSSNITGNAATATTATNSDTVDNKHISVVTSLPSSPDSNTIYFVTS